MKRRSSPTSPLRSLIVATLLIIPCKLFAATPVVLVEETDGAVEAAGAPEAEPVIGGESARHPTRVRRPRGKVGGQAPVFQGVKRVGFFAFGKFGAAYHRATRKTFCLDGWSEAECPINTQSGFGYDGELGVGYRFIPSVAITLQAHLGSFAPSNRDQRAATHTKTKPQAKSRNLKYYTHIKYLSIEGYLRVYPLLLTGLARGVVGQGVYLEGGGGYSFVDYGNPVNINLHSTREGIARGGIGFDYPLRPDLSIGIQLSGGYIFNPVNQWIGTLDATITYFF